MERKAIHKMIGGLVPAKTICLVGLIIQTIAVIPLYRHFQKNSSWPWTSSSFSQTAYQGVKPPSIMAWNRGLYTHQIGWWTNIINLVIGLFPIDVLHIISVTVAPTYTCVGRNNKPSLPHWVRTPKTWFAPEQPIITTIDKGTSLSLFQTYTTHTH